MQWFELKEVVFHDKMYLLIKLEYTVKKLHPDFYVGPDWVERWSRPMSVGLADGWGPMSRIFP